MKNTNTLPSPKIWLVPLRFILLTSQLAVCLSYKGLTPSAFTLVLPLLLLTFISNILLIKKYKKDSNNQYLLSGILILDILQLTYLLNACGGASNPFSIFFFLYLVLAALILPRIFAWPIGLLTMITYGSLLLFSEIPHQMHSLHGFSDHLFGMWIAYVAIGLITLTAITYLAREIKHLLKINEKHNQDKDRLQSLTSLATGAAHELGSPLNTLLLQIDSLKEDTPISKDKLHLIRKELYRCKSILSDLQNSSGTIPGETPSTTSLKELLEQIKEDLNSPKYDITYSLPSGSFSIITNKRSLIRALKNLASNALEASKKPIKISAFRKDNYFIFQVQDEGPGIPSDIIKRIGEPFISTKKPGEGMGLGIFISKLTAESLDGKLNFYKGHNGGTIAEISIPIENRR